MEGVSVIICCFNSAGRLQTTLEWLSRQELQAGILWEVIVVDNNSTDGTAAIATRHWQRLDTQVPMKVLTENQPGLSHARLKGITKAQYSIIVFCDDDNWLAPDYIRTAKMIMDTHPEFGIVGGRAEAVADQPLPGWFYESQWVFACGALNNNSMDFTGNAYIRGAGMVIRKKLANIIINERYPMLLTGRKGGSLISGDDDEKCLRTWLTGYKTWYDYRLLLYHYIPAGRLNTEYRDRVMAGFKHQVVTVNAYSTLYALQQQRQWGLKFFKQLGMYLYGLVTGGTSAKRIAGNYLFYMTRLGLWRSTENEAVWHFYKSLDRDCIRKGIAAGKPIDAAQKAAV